MNDLFEHRTAGGLDLLICRALAAKKLPHGFTYRWRRVEEENRGGRVALGLPARERDDREELSRALNLDVLAQMRQVHGVDVEVATQPEVHPPVCDGLLTRREGIGLLVLTADCVPLLMWDARQNVSAAVHAGWRGTSAGVARRAVEGFRRHFGSKPDWIHVAMGPSIGPCCYEVGEDVVRAFGERVPDSEDLFTPGPRGRKHLDLIEANRRQLAESGVPMKQVHASRRCTSCDNDLFYSFRKEGKGVGTLMAIIGAVLSPPK